MTAPELEVVPLVILSETESDEEEALAALPDKPAPSPASEIKPSVTEPVASSVPSSIDEAEQQKRREEVKKEKEQQRKLEEFQRKRERKQRRQQASEVAVTLRQLPPARESWCLCATRDWASCLEDENGTEYFPWVVLLGSSPAANENTPTMNGIVGLGSAPDLDPLSVLQFVTNSGFEPVDGQPRSPVRLCLDSSNQALCGGLSGELGEIGLDTVEGQVPEELRQMLLQVCQEQAKQNAAKEEARECQACGNPIAKDHTASRCKGCLAVHYCSRACQKADWKAAHKKACERMAGQMRRAGEVANLPFPYAPELTGDLARAKWVRWLIERQLHNKGAWRRESGSFLKVPYGELSHDPPPCREPLGDALYPGTSRNSTETNRDPGLGSVLRCTGASDGLSRSAVPPLCAHCVPLDRESVQPFPP